MNDSDNLKYEELAEQIKFWGKEVGFSDIGISDVDLSTDENHYKIWIENKYQADMDYMSAHGTKRTRPQELHPGTLRIISCRLNYLPEKNNIKEDFFNTENAYISRYALGRDYHKVLKKKLKLLESYIKEVIFELDSRFFVDSAPVLERALAKKAGLGWIGKNSMLIDSKDGSFFFLGNLFVNIPLPVNRSIKKESCGKCSACLKVCPTGAIKKPYIVDSAKCISFQTIENKAAIPEEIRPLIGNRIYGCDDCQIICPWNKGAARTLEKDFEVREKLTNQKLVEIFKWTEADFLKHTEGSPIRRIGYERWIRNVAVAIGNSECSPEKIDLLKSKIGNISKLVDEHINWAIDQLNNVKKSKPKRFNANVLKQL